MNKTDLINHIAETVDLTKANSQRVVESILEAIANTLTDGGQVVIPGFGTFSVGDRAARTGRNPQTGETIQIAAAKVVKFKAGKQLKDAVNEAAEA